MELKGKVEESLQQGRENGNDLKMLRRELGWMDSMGGCRSSKRRCCDMRHGWKRVKHGSRSWRLAVARRTVRQS